VYFFGFFFSFFFFFAFLYSGLETGKDSRKVTEQNPNKWEKKKGEGISLGSGIYRLKDVSL